MFFPLEEVEECVSEEAPEGFVLGKGHACGRHWKEPSWWGQLHEVSANVACLGHMVPASISKLAFCMEVCPCLSPSFFPCFT